MRERFNPRAELIHALVCTMLSWWPGGERPQPLAASPRRRSAFQWAYARLTRRRDRHANQEASLIYYGDVHVGTLSLRSGNPTTTEPWGWRCGFYPGSEPGDASSGTAATFWEARTAFEAAWRIFLAKRTEADFQAWRDQRDRTARKYALWDAGRRLPRPEWERASPATPG